MEYAIKTKVEEIALTVREKISQLPCLGLLDGKFGNLLFLYRYSAWSENRDFSDFTDRLAEELISSIQKRVPTYCSGVAGIFYLFDYLQENGLVEINTEEIRESIDSFLLASMRQEMVKKHYDFLHGALGMGLYFMKRKQQSPVNELIEYLDRTAVHEQDFTCKWESIYGDSRAIKKYNISLSHGISSIVLFLVHAIRSGYGNEKAFQLLEGAVNFLLSQEIDFQTYGSCFPSHSKELITMSRLGWCYGDLGIAYSIWQAGKVTGRKDWMERGLEVLRVSTTRHTFEETFVTDAGLCHGSSGIAMIYRRLYLQTGEGLFREATEFWIHRTLQFSGNKDGVAGFKNSERADFWTANLSFISGVSGIGMLFLSLLENDAQEWDKLFLL
jgi:lantibiotic modifying enzyme